MTDISIITVSYRGWERLTKSLEALNSFKGDRITTEVVIVDNKSEDDTIHALESRFSSFRFIHNPVNGGFANGCNLGASKSSGEFLLFLNPDTIATEKALEDLVSIARSNPEISILSCRQVNEKGKESIASGEFPGLWNLTGFQRAIFRNRFLLRQPANASGNPDSGLHTPDPAPRTPHLSFPDWVSGSVILIRKKLFQKVGGFDEDFWMYFEDVDICKRVTEGGSKVAFCNNITIEHNHGGSSRVNIRTASLTKTEVHISRHVYISKHKKGIEKQLIQIFLVLNNLVTSSLMAVAGLILFFIPKIFARTVLFAKLIKYYSQAIISQTWVSPRSVNSKNVKKI
jgi:GT2 family glycosyltransferase